MPNSPMPNTPTLSRTARLELPEELEIKKRGHQDNAEIHDQPFPEAAEHLERRQRQHRQTLPVGSRDGGADQLRFGTHIGVDEAQPVGLGPQCAAEVLRVAQHTEIAPQKDVPDVSGHPLTSVVVTQCNLIVAVYLTMQDGTLLRFDSHATVSADQLLQMAYTATRSERVEVSCNDTGAVGFEKHEPM